MVWHEVLQVLVERALPGVHVGSRNQGTLIIGWQECRPGHTLCTLCCTSGLPDAWLGVVADSTCIRTGS